MMAVPKMAANEVECGCSGIRACLRCENRNKPTEIPQKVLEGEGCNAAEQYSLCSFCGNTVSAGQTCMHVRTDNSQVKLDGVIVIHDFVTEDEESMIVSEVDSTIWKPSQSGRRKQDFGPQVNFKKRKLKWSNFTGLPQFSKVLVERMWSLVPELSDFQPVELCNLEYVPDRGSSIDPHFDDWWVWGDRLVTLNLLSESILTFSDILLNIEVAVPMPRRSLIIVKGPARYKWKHAIKRQDIVSRRIAITLRELSQEFCEGGASYDIGSELMRIALTFQGTAVQIKVKEHDG